MQTVACPSCGAQVSFRSHAAVMAVCEYCRSTVLKEPGAVKDLGKISAVLEDFSPIQIGTSGVFGARAFTVVGRIQLRYASGMWNEWFLVFDDGSDAWLGDSSGLYTLTVARAPQGALPAFDAIVPGNAYSISGMSMVASEVRRAQCIGGQGELPFRVGDGWQARVADLRAGARFVTLDYSESDAALLFDGTAVTLEELKCQLLRDDEQIKASAGKYRGKTDALDCPSCGSAIAYIPGVTAHLICPACRTQLDASGPEAQVVAAGERMAQCRTTLQLGAVATINGKQWTVIGAMRRADEEDSEWTEYLLYNTSNAFFWLVETPEGWSRASVMAVWPQWNANSDSAQLDQASYRKQWDYTATVRFAAGAFNWRVSAGDAVRVIEFKGNSASLAAEMTDAELTWSRSTPLATDQVNAWLGTAIAAPPAARSTLRAAGIARFFLWTILIVNAVPLLFNFSGSVFPVALAALAVYLPSLFLGPDDKG